MSKNLSKLLQRIPDIGRILQESFKKIFKMARILQRILESARILQRILKKSLNEQESFKIPSKNPRHRKNPPRILQRILESARIFLEKSFFRMPQIEIRIIRIATVFDEECCVEVDGDPAVVGQLGGAARRLPAADARR